MRRQVLRTDEIETPDVLTCQQSLPKIFKDQ